MTSIKLLYDKKFLTNYQLTTIYDKNIKVVTT